MTKGNGRRAHWFWLRLSEGVCISVGHVLIFDDVGRPRPLLEVLYSRLPTTRAPPEGAPGEDTEGASLYTAFLRVHSLRPCLSLCLAVMGCDLKVYMLPTTLTTQRKDNEKLVWVLL